MWMWNLKNETDLTDYLYTANLEMFLNLNLKMHDALPRGILHLHQWPAYK